MTNNKNYNLNIDIFYCMKIMYYYAKFAEPDFKIIDESNILKTET